MKKIFFIPCLFFIQNILAQNVGIGTTDPKARLQVADSSVLFSVAGTSQSGAGMVPEQGTGRRMLWFAPKAALRAGYAAGNRWDTDSIGLHSFATGNGTLAKGAYSFSAGFYSKAGTILSIAMGQNSEASGDYAAAIGNYCVAAGLESLAIGPGNRVYGRGARGIGYGATATGDFSISLGDGSFSEGMSATATGAATHASGPNSFASGYFSTASGNAAFSGGAYSVASGNSSFAAGSNCTATGISSLAMGNFAYAYGDAAMAMGFSIFAKAKAAATFGEYNDLTDNPSATTESATDRIFQLGNGLSNQTRSNAITVLRNGNTGIGTIAPSQKLQVVGNILASGTITPSDRRFKEDIQPITAPLEKLQQINGVTYHYKTAEFPANGFDDRQQVGVIAQEVEAVLPQLVFTDDKGYKAVDYSKLVPLLIESIKAQQKQIESLQQEVKKLAAEK